MAYEDLIVLIPCHSLEDFPTELPDAEAASLLNSWVIPWHPQLIAAAGVVPRWHRADDPPEITEKRLILVPSNTADLIPAGWIERARNDGSVVITNGSDREAMIAEAIAPLEPTPALDPDLAADFLALGFCYLQVELLTRHMRHFSNLDEVHLQREAVAAANAACAGDAETARTRLRACFDVLTEARERFYPVDCYLIDLCLLIPRLADQHLTTALRQMKPLNILVAAEALEEISREHPEVLPPLREAWERGSVDLIGGELREAPTPLLPLESVLWQFAAGRELFRQVLGRQPTVWGRRRYGLFPQLPQILQKFGYLGGMHVALDDGFYPDMEYSKIRWEGPNGSVIDGISRIPLAAEGANSYLRFPLRMAESMDNDHVAAVLFARWPEVKSPFFDDLRRMYNYSPVLGRFITLDDYFQHTDSAGRLSAYNANEYLAPFLVQAVARQEADPISRFTNHFVRRQKFDTAEWMRGMRAALIGQSVADALDPETERLIEQAEPDADAERVQAADTRLDEFFTSAARQLSELITSGGGKEPGLLVINTLAFPRTVSVPLNELQSPPGIGGHVKFVQWDEQRKFATLSVPGSGFVWLPKSSPAGAGGTRAASVPMAEPNVLRNEFFEVYLNEQTGGIGQIKGYGRSPNRLSQQLAFRFPRERRIVRGGEEDQEEIRTFYSQMQVTSSEVTCAGPALGEIVTTGELIDQTNGRKLAGFRQTYRVWRGRPVVEIDIELDITHEPDGDPWSNYYAVRFAWNDSTAAVTRSVMMGAQEIKEQRYESPHYLEIATEEQRTTILNLGQPYHRKTGERMVDSILVVAGETRRRFQFVVAIDQNYPMQAALDALAPVALVPTAGGPPRTGDSGWFFHLNARNVQITRILGLQAEPPEHVDLWDRHDYTAPVNGPGVAVRLLETEGRPIRAQLRCFRTPVSARQRDFQGRTICDLTVEGDVVTIDLTAYEIADVEIRFA